MFCLAFHSLKVVPGERFPADGVIVKGTTTVDESMITGESMPVTKGSEAVVIGGTLNQEGLVWVRATNVGSDTTLSNIIKLVETAQLSKPSIQVFADKLSAYFVPTVLIIAVVTFSIWFALTTAGVVPAEWIPANQGEFLFSFLFGYFLLCDSFLTSLNLSIVLNLCLPFIAFIAFIAFWVFDRLITLMDLKPSSLQKSPVLRQGLKKSMRENGLSLCGCVSAC